MSSWPPLSVIMAVRNEEPHLAAAVERILAQGYPGDLELVIAVGPSRDRTSEVAERVAAQHPAVNVVANPVGITPAGLNAAIAATRHAIVVRVDGHSFLPAGYLCQVVRLLEETGADNVGGLMAAEGTTPFEQAVAAAMTSPLGIGSARFHVGGESGPVDSVYLGAFRRAALDRVGGYDVRFVRAQDWELNYRIRETGGVVWFSPDLQVSYRPRDGWRALARQFFDTGRWRRHVTRVHPRSMTLRYLAPPLVTLAVALGLVAGLWWPWALVVPLGYAVGVLAAAGWLSRRCPPSAALRLPLVLPTMHLCWGAGFLLGPPR